VDFMEGLAWQVIGQINALEDGHDGDPRSPNNCCPICCGPCHALNVMLDDPIMLNQLSEIIALTRWANTGWDYWHPDGHLDAARIKSMWYNTDGTRKAVCVSLMKELCGVIDAQPDSCHDPCGICNQPYDHYGVIHTEMRDGQIWAEWRSVTYEDELTGTPSRTAYVQAGHYRRKEN